MAHQIEKRNGKYEFAHAGARAWHGLGQQILPTDDLDTIVAKGGLNWRAERAAVSYLVTVDGREESRSFENRSVIYRSDTGEALSVQSDSRYNIHQPADIANFFREFLAERKVTIDTIGALKGGKIVWALAKLGPEFQIKAPDGSKVFPYVRLQTSFDGSRATSLAATVIRQVCANTEAAVEADTRSRQRRVSHVIQWSDDVVEGLKAEWEQLGSSLSATEKVWAKLHSQKLPDGKVKAVFASLLGINLAEIEKTSAKQRGQLEALLSAYKSAPGAVPGTAFGALQAVTYYADHQSIVRDTAKDGTDGARIASAQFGTGAQLKLAARERLLELAA
jgi:phage/plasmid-like protein (TIGR03299 family)